MSQKWLKWYIVLTFHCSPAQLVEPIPSDSPGQKEFFDVHRGTFRHMDVTVSVIKQTGDWSYEHCITFLQEANFLRYVISGKRLARASIF